MTEFKQYYQDEVIPKLKEKFNYTSPMQVPKLEKIVLNMGMGEAIHNIKLLDTAVEELRIIAGRWRGRRLAFAPVPGLRPTPDRVRETLFN